MSFFIYGNLKYILEISYLGKNYCGWQKQPNVISIQTILENCLSKLLREDIKTLASGRTDVGVHAKQQYVQFNCQQNINKKQMIFQLNNFLPQDINIINIFTADDDFSVRYDAIYRSYEYVLNRTKNPFLLEHSFFFPALDFNFELINEASKLLIGQKDFTSFSKVHTDVKHFDCHIMKAEWKKDSTGNIWTFYITGDRFLRGMVRCIVGTLIEIGMKTLSVNDLTSIIESKDRKQAKRSVPSHGLYLSQIVYPENVFKDL